jgi:hypothetical protein
MRAILPTVLIASVVTSAAWGAAKTGPDRGQVIPEFSARDQKGKLQTLATIAGPKGAMLVFYRSADW